MIRITIDIQESHEFGVPRTEDFDTWLANTILTDLSLLGIAVGPCPWTRTFGKIQQLFSESNLQRRPQSKSRTILDKDFFFQNESC